MEDTPSGPSPPNSWGFQCRDAVGQCAEVLRGDEQCGARIGVGHSLQGLVDGLGGSIAASNRDLG